MADNQKKKIGLYLCLCGGGIGLSENAIKSILEQTSKWEDVGRLKTHNLLCTKDGLQFIKSEIEGQRLDRIIIAACSPKMHEDKFKKMCEEAGLNPYFLQIANIREQGTWVIEDEESLTKRVLGLIRGAINRVKLHEPLYKREIECNPDVVVIGAGVSGIRASLLIARAGRRVFLVEKNPNIGGLTARFEKVYPTMECASCMLAEQLQEVLRNENIEVLTYSELVQVRGFLGNFITKIKKKAKFVKENICIGCGACIEVCPVEVKNEYDEGLSNRKAIYVPFAGALPNIPVVDKENCIRFQGRDCNLCEKNCPFGAIDWNDEDKMIEKSAGAIILSIGANVIDKELLTTYGYGKIPNIFTDLQLERILAENGPTKGKLLLEDGREPLSCAFIYCVGRDEKGYCSGICCPNSIKLSLLIKEKSPNIRIENFYRDLCLPKKEYEKLYKEAINKGVQFIKIDKKPEISYRNGKIIFDSGESYDMVVLPPVIAPNEGTENLANMLDIPLDEQGYFCSGHALMAPVSTICEGVYIAGSAGGAKDIADAIAQGSAVAGEVLSRIMPGRRLELEPIIVEMDKDFCSKCGICLSLCPYSAINYEKDKSVSVNEILCRGCGICAAVCPSGILKLKHYKEDQVLAELEGIIQEDEEPIIVAFLCSWCSYQAADGAGQAHLKYPANIMPIKLMCTGNLAPFYIFKAFQQGASGVIVLGCHPGACHYKKGNLMNLRRAILLKTLLKQFGIEEERFKIDWVSATEGRRFAEIANEMVETVRKLGKLKLQI